MNYLGIDIGGTQVKLAVLNNDGSFIYKNIHSTLDWKNAGFVNTLKSNIHELLILYPQIERIGIGIPGLMNAERNCPVMVFAIPELNQYPLLETLKNEFPQCNIVLEKDSNMAAMGEKKFNKNIKGDFVFITLGTGVGAAAILNNRIFYGGNGGSMQLGLVHSGNGRSLENNIGVQGIQEMIKGKFSDYKLLIEQAESGNQLALSMFNEISEILATSIADTILLLDITMVVIGGGLSAGFHLIERQLNKNLQQKLIPYYADRIKIIKAQLGNDAGILGAIAIHEI